MPCWDGGVHQKRGVSVNGECPKKMVGTEFMENPQQKLDDFGGYPHFRKPPSGHYKILYLVLLMFMLKQTQRTSFTMFSRSCDLVHGESFTLQVATVKKGWGGVRWDSYVHGVSSMATCHQ